MKMSKRSSRGRLIIGSYSHFAEVSTFLRGSLSVKIEFFNITAHFIGSLTLSDISKEKLRYRSSAHFGLSTPAESIEIELKLRERFVADNDYKSRVRQVDRGMFQIKQY